MEQKEKANTLSNQLETSSQETAEQAPPLTDYELYCKQQTEAFMDDLGDDRCFGDMAEGMFVRGH